MKNVVGSEAASALAQSVTKNETTDHGEVEHLGSKGVANSDDLVGGLADSSLAETASAADAPQGTGGETEDETEEDSDTADRDHGDAGSEDQTDDSAAASDDNKNPQGNDPDAPVTPESLRKDAAKLRTAGNNRFAVKLEAAAGAMEVERAARAKAEAKAERREHKWRRRQKVDRDYQPSVPDPELDEEARIYAALGLAGARWPLEREIIDCGPSIEPGDVNTPRDLFVRMATSTAKKYPEVVLTDGFLLDLMEQIEAKLDESWIVPRQRAVRLAHRSYWERLVANLGIDGARTVKLQQSWLLPIITGVGTTLGAKAIKLADANKITTNRNAPGEVHAEGEEASRG
jgi:hypothetical protein